MTSQINVREIAEEYKISKQVNTALDKMLAIQFPLERSSFSQMATLPEILELCNATGLAIQVEGTLYKAGLTPADDNIRKVIDWCQSNSVNGYFSSSFLSSSYPDFESICDTASGVIFQSLDLNHRNSIIWLRQENIREVHWAGDPDKAIVKDKDQLSPRKSFASWKGKRLSWRLLQILPMPCKSTYIPYSSVRRS
jgi:light-regulated signal transduction histidine kinase (bacteriophytochrome)